MQIECLGEVFIFGEDRQLSVWSSAEEHSSGGTAEIELALVYGDGEDWLSIALSVRDDFTSIDGDLRPSATTGDRGVKDTSGE